MNDSKKYRVRVYYVKHNRLSFLSHLETARCIEYSIRRANLPYMLSCGFRPHMKISYGPALPLGITSDAEIYDLSLTEYMDSTKILLNLKNCCHVDIAPYKIVYIERNEQCANLAFANTSYEAIFSIPLKYFIAPDFINLKKRNKTKKIFINDYLKSDFKLQKQDNDFTKIKFVLKKHNSSSLSPIFLLEEAMKFSNINNKSLIKIKKLKIF